MAKKKIMKLSEARILVFLNTSSPENHYVASISGKLQIDYGYIMKILANMKYKNWIKPEKTIANPSKTFYHLTAEGKEQLTIAQNIAAEIIKPQGAEKTWN